MNRYDMFPHIEDRMTMTVREWIHYHWTMHRHFTKYLGKHLLKTPFDVMVLGEIIEDTRPPLILEIGSYDGGSALWMANLCDALGLETRIVSVDIADHPGKIAHPRIAWVVGDCLAPDTQARVADAAGELRGMVIEDSDHKYHVTKGILEAYERYVARDCYFVVEDTIVEFINMPPFPGPLKAVHEFMASHQESFVIDRSREKYIITHNPMGYLLRTG